MRKHSAIMGLLCLLFVGAAHAQWVAPDGCHVSNGGPISARPSASIPDIALATFDPYSGEPLIYFNPYVLCWLPAQLRTWIFAHECAHLVLDHLRFGNITPEQEIEADCWATAQLTAQGVLSPMDLDVMEEAIAKLLPRHWMHMPGRFRAIQLRRCALPPLAMTRVRGLPTGSATVS